jgi:hypothetical protein
MVQVLAEHFKTITDTLNYPPRFQEIKEREEAANIIPYLGEEEDYNTPFAVQELDHALRCCKGSSPGPSDVHYQMIKELPHLANMKLLEI